MKNYLILTGAALTALMLTGPAAAQDDEKTLDELLSLVERGIARDDQAERARQSAPGHRSTASPTLSARSCRC